MTEFAEDRVYDRHRRRRGAVLIVGAGAVGGFLAEELARIGISPLVLVDRDVLEQENLVRHPLGAEALGQPKASGLANKIRRDFPLCDARGVDADFLTLRERDQRALVRDADVVVAATDVFECQRSVNRVCLAAEKPCVFPAIWVDPRVRDAEVSEILWVLPGRHTPCYECAVAFRQAAADAQAARGARVDIQLLALTTAQVVMGLVDPTDEIAAMLDPERTCIYVHGFTPTSPGIRRTFPTEGLRNVYVHVPFPQTACPACGGRQAAPRPPTTVRPRPAPPPAPRVERRTAWAWAALAVIVLVLVITAASHLGSGSGSAASQGGPYSGSQAPASPLPRVASTSFDVRPVFDAASSSITTVWSSGSGPAMTRTIMTPSQRGFELMVKVSAHFTSYGLSNYGNTAADLLDAVRGNGCLNVDTSLASGSRNGPEEQALETHLTASGSYVTGYLVYAAVLPGFYVPCLSDGIVSLGRVTSPALGTAYGNSLGNYLVVFAERTSRTDTVLMFGAIGETGDALSPARGMSCLTPAADNTVEWPPNMVTVVQRHYGTGTYPNSKFEVGTITFDRPASSVSGGMFNYNCAGDDGQGVTLQK